MKNKQTWSKWRIHFKWKRRSPRQKDTGEEIREKWRVEQRQEGEFEFRKITFSPEMRVRESQWDKAPKLYDL